MTDKLDSLDKCTNYADSLKLVLMAVSMRKDTPSIPTVASSEPCTNYKTATEPTLISGSLNKHFVQGIRILRDASPTISAGLKISATIPRNNI